jgi:hypothetical protein
MVENPTEFRMQQRAMFFRRIQVILIGVIAVSVLEHSAKRDEQLQADRANQRIAKTSQRKTLGQTVAPQPIKPATPSSSKTQISKSPSSKSPSSKLQPSKPL